MTDRWREFTLAERLVLLRAVVDQIDRCARLDARELYDRYDELRREIIESMTRGAA